MNLSKKMKNTGMDDRSIMELCHARDESALQYIMEKYDKYLMVVAGNFLVNREDRIECLNDAYYRFWTGTLPKKPELLKTCLSKCVREAAVDLYRRDHRKKRIHSEYTLSIEELSEIISDSGNDPQKIIEKKELAAAIGRFLATRPKVKRVIFVMRYYYMDSVSDIVKHTGFTRSKVTVTLSRELKSLRDFLNREGYIT